MTMVNTLQAGGPAPHSPAAADLEWLVQEARAAGEPEVLARALSQQAAMSLRLGQAPLAAALAAEAVQTAPRAPSAVSALMVLGLVAAGDNRLSAADQYFNQAIALGQETGELAGAAVALHHLALTVHVTRGRHELALAATEALAGLERHGSRLLVWSRHFLQFKIARRMGQRAKARQSLAAFAAGLENDELALAIHQLMRAQLALDEEDLDTALPALEACAPFLTSVHPPSFGLWYRLERSRGHRLAGTPQAALAWAEEADRYAQHLHFDYLCGRTRFELARVRWQLGELELADRHLREALHFYHLSEAAYDQAQAEFLLAVLSAERADPQAGAAFITASRSIRAGGFEALLELEREWAFPFLAQCGRDSEPAIRAAAADLLELLVRTPPPPLRVYGLGRFRVFRGRRTVPPEAWEQRRAGALFRLLLIQPQHTMRRELLVETLWPEQPETATRQKLHHATSALRRILEPDLPDKFPSRYISVEMDTVSLHLPAGSSVDFETFQGCYQRFLSGGDRSALAEALVVYHGELFPDAGAGGWEEPLREKLRGWYLAGWLRLGEYALAENRLEEALDAVRHVLEREPWSEEAVQIGMRVHLQQFNRPAALRLYHRLHVYLRREFELEPRADLKALADQLHWRDRPG